MQKLAVRKYIRSATALGRFMNSLMSEASLIALAMSCVPALVSAFTASWGKVGLRAQSEIAFSTAPPPPTWMSGQALHARARVCMCV